MCIDQSDNERLVNSYGYACAILRKHNPLARPYEYPRLMDVLAQIDALIEETKKKAVVLSQTD